MNFNPAPASLLMNSALSSVEMTCFSFCKPSRAPHSRIVMKLLATGAAWVAKERVRTPVERALEAGLRSC